MLKNILNLEGAQKLTKNEQKEINGGTGCSEYSICYEMDMICVNGMCVDQKMREDPGREDFFYRRIN
ncbi:hypothetical protein [Flavobacterium sp. ZB4P13]|uniref:hypothetical protein n=1 Tax=Flavobacterium sp. ZB4P13 TaxID=3401728 RepID=UPI003AABF2A0